jgi:hypothetical protein
MNWGELLCLFAWLSTALLSTLSAMIFARRARRFASYLDAPPCVILSPVKNYDVNLDAYLAALIEQDYGKFRVVFVVEDTRDPAYPRLCAVASSSPIPMSVAVAGVSDTCGQKVFNLLHGLERLVSEDRIVVFADADTIPAPDWLRQLVRPIALGHAHLTTGYLLMVPRNRTSATIAACLISLPLATYFAPSRTRLCWGGSTAVSREALSRLDLPFHWRGSLSDDLSLTRAARTLGLFPHATLATAVPTFVAFSWEGLFSYACRQYRLVRVYALKEWMLGAWILLVPCVGFWIAWARIFEGQLDGALALIFSLILQNVRLRARRAGLAKVLDSHTFARMEPVFRAGRWAGLLVHPLHTCLMIASAWGRTVQWAGTVYRFRGPHGRLEIMARQRNQFQNPEY